MFEAGERLRKRWYLEQFILFLLVNLRYVMIEFVRLAEVLQIHSVAVHLIVYFSGRGVGNDDSVLFAHAFVLDSTRFALAVC